jgi:ketosteroid isomerase-like protein
VEVSRDKVDVAKRMVDAYNLRDVHGAFAELVTPDFEWHPGIVKALGGGGYRGRESVEKFAADTRENWEELQIIAGEFRDLGDRVLVLGRMRGRGKRSGAPIDQPFATILDFRGERSRVSGGITIARKDCGWQDCPSRHTQRWQRPPALECR